MRIGIDIDGVLTDIERWQLDYSSKFYFEKYNKKIVNHKGYDTSDIFGTSQDQDNEFWTEYYKEYATKIDVRKFASEVMKKLKNDGNEIYIITARSSFLLDDQDATNEIISSDENKEITINWLKKNEIEYDKIIFSQEDKLEECLSNNINLMIEDKTSNIEKISKEIPVICVNAGYNESCTGENIYRCYSWYDIYYTIINKLKVN